MWADLDRKLPAAVRNVSHSVYSCSDCWQNFKPVHNMTCFSLALVSLHSSCFSKEVMFLSSFSNSLIPAPPDQPFYTNKIIKLSLSIFWEACRRLLLLFPPSYAKSFFHPFSFCLSPLQSHSSFDSMQKILSHISSHLSQPLSTLFP